MDLVIDMGKTSYAPTPDHLIDELSKVRPKHIVPDHTSETWEVISLLRRKRLRRKWRRWIAGSALAFAAAAAIAAMWQIGRRPDPSGDTGER
jgi:hypothetical protein